MVDAQVTKQPAEENGTTPLPAVVAADRRAVFTNVWSRTEPKYRIRAAILLLVNLLLFCGLCVFTHWLHVAHPFDFSWASYTAPMKFWGEQTQNLNDFVLYPISVEQTPMQGIVLGLLVASIVAVPISVAILYRFPYAMPFVAAVLIFAHLPWLALTLIACCLLSSVKPFRLSFRFGAALVGVLPVIIYLYLATRGTPQQIGTYASPDQKVLLTAPWVLAIIAACAMLGVILTISRIVNYRPGAVAPVMAIMFATPTLLFYAYVGFDEVSYRVLEAEYGPRSQRFAAQDARDKIFALFGTQLDKPTQEQLLGVFAGRVEPLLALHQRLTHRLLKELLSERRDAYEACRKFIADHPTSRYVPNALYIQAWALDARLDVRKLLLPSGSPRRELYSDYPHVQSEEAWLPLLNRYPDSPLAIAARLRLAQLRLRQGQVTRALEFLSDLQPTSAEYPETQTSTQPTAHPLRRTAQPESSLGFESEPYLREGRRLYELITANQTDPKYGDLPLQQLAGLDPHRQSYLDQLLHLAGRYHDALLYDNLVVQWATAEPNRARRAAKLAACIRTFPDGDAAAEAMFLLAELEVRARGEGQETRRQTGLTRLRSTAERFPDGHWGRQAAERLRLLQPQSELEPATPVQP